MNMNHIIPAILAHNEEDFRAQLQPFEEVASIVQLDVLDETLYQNTSWHDMQTLDTLETAVWLELHLMVADPAVYIEQIQRGGPIQRVIWHVEAPIDHAELLLTCESRAIEAGLAIAPQTSLEELRPFAEMLSEVLVLGVEPGFSGQTLIQKTIQKVRAIHEEWPHLLIGFDGGITEQNIAQLREAGVTRFYVSSAIWNAEDPVNAYETLTHA